MNIFYYYLPAFGNGFIVTCYDFGQFSAKFQIWCRKFNITDKESLALWILNTGRETSYFKSKDECETIAKLAYHKLPLYDGLVDLSNI